MPVKKVFVQDHWGKINLEELCVPVPVEVPVEI